MWVSTEFAKSLGGRPLNFQIELLAMARVVFDEDSPLELTTGGSAVQQLKVQEREQKLDSGFRAGHNGLGISSRLPYTEYARNLAVVKLSGRQLGASRLALAGWQIESHRRFEL